jgi:hypothetical protein
MTLVRGPVLTSRCNAAQRSENLSKVYCENELHSNSVAGWSCKHDCRVRALKFHHHENIFLMKALEVKSAFNVNVH